MRSRLACVTVLLVVWPASASAACSSISASNLVFGTYTGGTVAVAATLTVNCSAGFDYVIGLNGGGSGVTTARTMTSAPVVSQLAYQMYQDAAHSVVWGDNNGVDTVSATGTGANQTFTIYGLMPVGQNVVPGSYADHPIAYVQSGPSASFSPMAFVPASCAISAGNLSFGTYAASTLYGNSTLTITCTDTTGWEVGLDAGTSAGATVASRAMTGPSASTLPYGLFQSNSYTQTWGMTSGTDTVTGTGRGARRR